MKKIFSALLLLVLSTSVLAWTIGPMNYQGRLLDNNGIPLTGSYNFKVRIYDALSGGTLKFSEQQNNIAVDDGVYSFLVSTGTSPTGTWDINLWNTPSLYLEIEVNGQTLTPRHLLASTPFAFQANLALTTNNALALGGKSSGAVLQDICKAGKGKWLDLVGQCLGVGAVITNQSSTALASDLNYTNLDLSNADLTGTTWGAPFATVDFSGALFKNTKITFPNLPNYTNFTNAIMDGVISPPGNAPLNLTGATISNTDMTGWNLTNAFIGDGASAADLIACPSTFPAGGFTCKPQKNGKYFIVGGGISFSETSLMKNRLNTDNLDKNVFTNVIFGQSDFTGNSIEGLDITNSDISAVKMTRVTIRNVGVINSDVGAQATYKNSLLINTHFDNVAARFGSLIFDTSELHRVSFAMNDVSGLNILDVKNSILNDVKFIHIVNEGVTNLNFTDTTLTNTNITAQRVQLLTFNNATISGGVYFESGVTHSASITNTNFGSGNIAGKWNNVAFSGDTFIGTTFNGANFSGTNGNSGPTSFSGGTFIGTTFTGANFTGVTGMSTATFTNVNWYGAKCPDGFQVTTLGGTCIGHGI